MKSSLGPIKSQTNLFTFLVGEIEKGKYIGSRSEIRGFIDDIISELRRGLFSTLEGDFLRQIEQSLLREDAFVNLEFLNIQDINAPIDPLTGTKISRNFILKISQSDLLRIDFTSWGRSDLLIETNLRSARSLVITGAIQNIVDYLEKLITDPTIGNSKVRIFPLVRVISQGIDYGYQFLIPRYTDDNPNLKAQSYRPYLPKIPSYFEIDLSNPSNKESIFTLYHITYLLLSQHQSGTPSRYRNLGFVMKASDGEWDDGEMIAAFNREGNINKDELFSVLSPDNNVLSSNHYHNYQMEIETQTYVIDDKEWERNFLYALILTSGASNSDFTNYMDFVRSDSSSFARYIREILGLPEP